MNGNSRIHSPVMVPPPPPVNITPGSHLSYSISPSPSPLHTNGAPNSVPPRGNSLVETYTGGVVGDFRVGQPRKKLILCFDGTGNKFKGNAGDTNILKIFRMLDRSGGEESTVHYYQPGIGTYITNGTLSRVHIGSRMKSWVDKAMDAAIGTSFDQHVIGGYKFLMRFYAPGDDIYMFGFSRGAYTARFLAEMLDHVGLVSQGNEEMVLFAWKTFSNWQQRHDKTKKGALYEYMRAFRETFARPVRRVRFLGLFDTVNSVPRFESAWLKRSSGFPYTARSTSRVIRHAVGIDERRAKFRQDLIDKVDVAEIARQRTWKAKRNDQKTKKSRKKKLKFLSSSNSIQSPTGNSLRDVNMNGRRNVNGEQPRPSSNPGSVYARSPTGGSMVSLNIFMDQTSDSEDEEPGQEQDIEEVWFPGAHGDIGGGWDLPPEEEPLSQGPLVWMVREARKFGVVFDKQRMKEQNCWMPEFEDDDTNSLEDSFETLPRPCTNGAGNPDVPTIEITATSPTEPQLPQLEPNPATDLHMAEANAHPNHHHLRHFLHRHHQQPEVPRYPPKEFLERSYTRGKIHDCLLFNNGIGHVGVLGWKIMEYLPFRRMDLQPDGSWKSIIWPLPCGEVRDIPHNAKIHCSVIKRMEADPKYRPGNLLVGGGGRGVRVAPAEHGMGDWVVVRDKGDLIGELLIKRTTWEDMKPRDRVDRFKRETEGDPEKRGMRS